MEYKPEEWVLTTHRIGASDRFVVEMQHKKLEYGVKYEANSQVKARDKIIEIIKNCF